MPRLSPNLLPSTVLSAAAIDITIIVLTWCLSMYLVASAAGDFPLNDDWSYGITAKHLLVSGQFNPPQQVFAPSITNVLWGLLFCLPRGFSFSALRLSTMAASLIGMCGSYALVRLLRQSRRMAILIALALAFNPIVYALSATFMTDVFFMAITTWSFFFFIRNLLYRSRTDLLFGTAFALAATLSRQLALAIPLAFATTLFLRSSASGRSLIRASAPLAVCAIGFLAFRLWLTSNAGTTSIFDARTSGLARSLLDIRSLAVLLFGNTFTLLPYLGLFLFPVLVLFIRDLPRHGMGKLAAIASLTAVTLAAGAVTRATHSTLFGRRLLMPAPTLGNIIVKSGIGPLTLRDTFLLNLDHFPSLPQAVWILITCIGLIGAVLLICLLAIYVLSVRSEVRRTEPMREMKDVGAFLATAGFVYLIPLLIANAEPYDRYLVPVLLPFTGALLAPCGKKGLFSIDQSRWAWTSGILIVLLFGFFAVAGTRDYLVWNRLRWQELYELLGSNVGPEDIDGGYEFNGLYLYDPNYEATKCHSYWWVHRDTYQISFGPVPGYRAITSSEYVRWLVPGRQNVLVLFKLQRNSNATSDPCESRQ